MQRQAKPTSVEVLEMVTTALRSPASSHSALRARLAHARELQRTFRSEPVGGKLVSLKKLFYWFTASSFDRQAKAVEALLDLTEDLVSKAEHSEAPPSPAPRGARSPLPSPGAEAGLEPTFEGEGSPRSLPAILHVDAEMMLPEKVVLYSLVFGLKPKRCLEIGTFKGGSAAVICAAMNDNGFGKLVCVDPNPQIPPQVRAAIAPRATILEGASPEVLPRARQAAGEKFTLALIDGDHSKEGALADTEGVLEHLSEGAHLLFHDCHFFDVEDAIDEALRRHPKRLVDCGIVSTARNPVQGENSHVDGKQVVWGGLRLLRYVGA